MGSVAQSTTTVVIVDDDPYALAALRLMVRGPEIIVLGVGSSVETGYAAIIRHTPRVALVDLLMQGDHEAGIRLVRQVAAAAAGTYCMLLTHTKPDGILLRDAFNAGARGFYRKGFLGGAELPEVILRLADGERMVDPDLTDHLLAALNIPMAQASGAPPLSADPQLSSRQCEVLKLINEGMSIAEIAKTLYLSEPTIKTHLRLARAKFSRDMNSQQLAVYAALKGLLESPRAYGSRQRSRSTR
jgi:DNA-binding NarL/FixJ family response regulator